MREGREGVFLSPLELPAMPSPLPITICMSKESRILRLTCGANIMSCGHILLQTFEEEAASEAGR